MKNRFKEPSTYAAITPILLLLGIINPLEAELITSALMTIGGAITALAGILLPEKKHEKT